MKLKYKLLFLCSMLVVLLFLVTKDERHPDMEEQKGEYGEELILSEQQEEGQTGEQAQISGEQENIRVLLLDKNGGIYHREKETDQEYPGELQYYEEENGWVIVNEVPLEEYLRYVVPSEMPSGYAMEALKAQAVCARTYAVWQMQKFAYPEYEAHVDDSVSFQVYHQIDHQETTDRAVEETKGQIMTYQGQPVKAYYFATSCGVTTDEEIWEDGDRTATPYIKGRRVGSGSMKKNLEQERVFERFIRKKHAGDLEISEPWYRWNCFLPLAQIEENLKRWQKEHPEEQDPGSIRNVTVTGRNTGGAVQKLLIEGTKATLEIPYENAIRQVLSVPGGTVYKNDGTTKEGSALLPSGYFVLEPVMEEGTLKGYEICGGGLGHGAGMSQNGARILAEQGETYEAILHYFYNEIELAILQ